MTRLEQLLTERLQGRVQADVPFYRLTTYRVGGPAHLLVQPAHADDVVALDLALRDEAGAGLPIVALGRGSNLVVSDAGFPGVVIRLASGFSRIEPWHDDGFSAGGATPLPLLSNWAARRGLAGMEFGVGIPGSVGGAVRMNAGAHGADMAAVTQSVKVWDLGADGPRWLDAGSLGFAYRRSFLADGQLVLGARGRLHRDDPARIRDRMDAYRRHRAETQPGAVQNAGSVFKNPAGDSAGRLVEAAGLKGFRVGGARVSELHANFFIASDGASAQDVFDLVHEVRRRVADVFGVTLEAEIRFIGEFRDPARRDARV